MLSTEKIRVIGVTLGTVLVLVGMTAHAVQASWMIDAAKFHISVHGQNACQDCHEDVADRDLHPDPVDVSRKSVDFFTAEQCLSCHDDVQEGLEQGEHGALPVVEPAEYAACIRCHDPHYQLASGPSDYDPGKPAEGQCGVCHEPQSELPAMSEDDEACLVCHGRVDPEDSQGRERITRLCFHCHARSDAPAQEITGQRVPLIDAKAYASVPHAEVACTVCHPQATGFEHAAQRSAECRQCHAALHDERVAHDAHIGVACGACHLQGVRAWRDPLTRQVDWRREASRADAASVIHQMHKPEDPQLCRQCHFPGNPVGAAVMVLPAKSILCMPCHTATLSLGDTTTILALVIFIAGLVLTFSYVLTGSGTATSASGPMHKLVRWVGDGARVLFSPRIVPIAITLLLDVFLQRRLFRRSQGRWFIHALIFYPFVIRFLFGVAALAASLVNPEGAAAWVMLDKNNPLTAFVFDLTGVMLLLGVVLAFIRGTLRQSVQLPGLPRQDRAALGLILAIVAFGFLLEGMRIAMTAAPGDAAFAFVGYAISRLFTDSMNLTGIYGYLWYVHAVLWGAFVAYLPFSRMKHIILAPAILAMDAGSGHDH